MLFNLYIIQYLRMHRFLISCLFLLLFGISHANEKPGILNQADTMQVSSSLNYPDLYKVIKSPVITDSPKGLKRNNLQIPAIKQGFFCRFEDRLQIKRKIPLNFGTD